jgi:hypothetical protein
MGMVIDGGHSTVWRKTTTTTTTKDKNNKLSQAKNISKK